MVDGPVDGALERSQPPLHRPRISRTAAWTSSFCTHGMACTAGKHGKPLCRPNTAWTKRTHERTPAGRCIPSSDEPEQPRSSKWHMHACCHGMR